MAQHATIDAAGRVTGFFDDMLHKALPAGSVKLTAAQYAAWVPNQTGLVWDHAASDLAPAPASPPIVPRVVSRYQLKAHLAAEPGSVPGKSLLDDVNAAVLLPGAGLLPIAWAEAASFHRDSVTITEIAGRFGWDAAKVDALFIGAASIEAP